MIRPEPKYDIGDQVFFGNEEYVVRYTSPELRSITGEPTYHLVCGPNDHRPALRSNVRESELSTLSLNQRMARVEAALNIVDID